jgi:sulfotransferase family protein
VSATDTQIPRVSVNPEASAEPAMADRRLPAVANPPIFVGGTGRSGTTILARLLGRRRDYTVIPVEARFHCAPDGLPGVLLGTQTPERFVQRVTEEWFHPPRRAARLAAFVDRDALDAALARFLECAGEDPLAAGRGLMDELFGEYARAQDRSSWVEMTPINAMWGAHQLARLYPELRFVNIIRDGRDVVSSLVGMGWMTDAIQALGWWEERMRRGHEQCRLLPAGSLLTIRFERLLVDDRERSLEQLHSFMGWDEDPAMRRFFARRMPAAGAHVGRWRTDFSGRERERLAAAYEAALTRLRAAGATTP